MKRIILTGLAILLFEGCSKEQEKPAADKNSEKAAGPESRVTRGPNGETIVTLDEAAQKQMGLKTETIAATQLLPEVTGYGRVVDPAPLASLVADMTAAQAANQNSQADLKRLKTLAAQNNASERALQAAEATAVRDQAQFESARLKLLANWGGAIASRADLPGFVQSLVTMEGALVRLDLSAGETLKSPPTRARLVNLTGEPIEAEFIGAAPTVDPQMQGRGFLFLVRPNPAKLAPGAAMAGFLHIPGEPLNGVVVPRSAVVRHEGAGWIFVQTDGTHFARHLIPLEHPIENGWFVTNGVAAGDNVVATGAQTVFSEEMNASGFMGGERD